MVAEAVEKNHTLLVQLLTSEEEKTHPEALKAEVGSVVLEVVTTSKEAVIRKERKT